MTDRGQTVLKGGWGRFNKIRFSGDVEPANSAAAVTTIYRWNDRNANRLWDAGEVDLDPNGNDFVSRSGLTAGGQGGLASLIPNPDEKAPQTDEFSASLEHELITNLAIRVTGVMTRDTNLRRVAGLGRPFESYNVPVSFRDPGPDARPGTADDGGALTYFEYPLALQGADYTFTTPVTADGLKNDYRALEFAASKRSSNNWQLLASLGRIWKNLDQRSDRIAYNPNALLFSGDNTTSWYAKIGGSYRFAWPDLLVSSNLNAVNGEPYARTVSATGGRTIPSIVLPVEPWGTRHYPNAYLLDLRVEKRFRLPGARRLSVRADVFNVANTNVATALTTQSGTRFEVPTAIMPARIVVFSGSLGF
jgi:hypothetical protein